MRQDIDRRDFAKSVAGAVTRRDFLKASAEAALGMTAAGAFGFTRGPKKRRANIVLILADDMGFSDPGCYGSEISTPNLDRLAAGGLRFTQFYNTAKCCPTRASLLTGLYPHQAGIGHMTEEIVGYPAYKGDLSAETVTIAEALRPAGYHSLMAGKWHVTPIGPVFTLTAGRMHVTPIDSGTFKHNWPLQRGFERYYGGLHGGGSYYDPPYLVRDNTFIEPEGKDYYYTDAISKAAVEFISEFGPTEDPFFLYVGYTAPHWPLHAFPDDIAKYRAAYKQGWDALRAERHKRQIEMGLVEPRWPLTPRDERVPAWDDAPNKEWQAERMSVYAAMVERMDRGVGRILEELKRVGKHDNTLILFLADNGASAEEIPRNIRIPECAPEGRAQTRIVPECTRDGRPVRQGNSPSIMPGPPDTFASDGVGWANASNTPFRLYKSWIHEGGIAAPFIAHWPGVVTPNSITHQGGHVMDIMATCLEVAGATYPETYRGNKIRPLEGKSLVPILRGQTRPGHAAICWEHEGNRAVRQGRWKLVNKYPDRWELYDMTTDRTEMRDLSTKEPGKMQELATIYDQWARRCGVVPWDVIKFPHP